MAKGQMNRKVVWPDVVDGAVHLESQIDQDGKMV
jgi:hypothetical protein